MSMCDPWFKLAAGQARLYDCLQEVKKLMEEKFKTGQNKWFFSKLRF